MYNFSFFENNKIFNSTQRILVHLLFSNMLLLHKTPFPTFQSKSAEEQNDEVDKRARREKKYSVR